jgi:hypothetical protein
MKLQATESASASSKGELGNFHYVDNLTRAIRQLGKILVDLIPKIYDAPRVMRIIGEDGTPKTQLINGSKLADSDPRKAKLKHFYDLDLGTYDVTVSAGPSYQTKRLEAVATQLELLKVIPPETGAMLLDLIASNMDLPGSELIVERLKKLLPPGLADDDENAQPISATGEAEDCSKPADDPAAHGAVERGEGNHPDEARRG